MGRAGGGRRAGRRAALPGHQPPADRAPLDEHATVTACDPGRRFAFAVGNDPDDPNTQWSYDFEPVGGGGTRVTERWKMLREPGIVLLYYQIINQPARIARGVEETLRRLKAAAEAR